MNKGCMLCGSSEVIEFLKRTDVPVHQNIIFPSSESARMGARGDLDMCVCASCGFVFNRSFDEKLLSYGPSYDNNQTCSEHFNSYLDEIVEKLVNENDVRDSVIVEVGCGRGQFLKKLIDYPGANNKGYGFDPSYVGPDTDLDGRIRFRKCFYDENCTDVAADVIICRHVIEHVRNPVELLQSVGKALAGSPRAKIFFETPCVEWILENGVLWDFFYEHCSLFTAKSLITAFQRVGFHVESVGKVFGGQYLWIEGAVTGASMPMVYSSERIVDLARKFSLQEKNSILDFQEKITRMKSSGPIALWGAGAKGVTLANLIDPQKKLIDCIVDLNPAKQGFFISGTGHPVVGPKRLKDRHVAYAVVMNPNYMDENKRILTDECIDTKLVFL